MHYPITISPPLMLQLRKVLSLTDQETLLDITAFGDVFIQRQLDIPNTHEHILYSFTDGTISNVSELVAEHGLPPVSLDLGDQWYQFNAQAMLKDDGLALAEGECFGFIQPTFEGGDYGPHNIHIVKITDYISDLLPRLTHT